MNTQNNQMQPTTKKRKKRVALTLSIIFIIILILLIAGYFLFNFYATKFIPENVMSDYSVVNSIKDDIRKTLDDDSIRVKVSAKSLGGSPEFSLSDSDLEYSYVNYTYSVVLKHGEERIKGDVLVNANFTCELFSDEYDDFELNSLGYSKSITNFIESYKDEKAIEEATEIPSNDRVRNEDTPVSKPEQSNVSVDVVEPEPTPVYSEYILPDSNTRHLSVEEISVLSAHEAMLARNEIYARHGRMFQTESIQEYFNSCSWYIPSVRPENFNESCFNEFENANLAKILKHEANLKNQ